MEDNKVKFFEMLGSITEVAKVQNNKITAEEVVSLFGDLELSKEQYDHVYAYLIANGITVEGASDETTVHVKAYQAVIEEVTEENEENEENEAVESTTDFEDGELHAMEGDIYKDSKKVTDPSSIQEEKDSMYLKMYLEDLSAIKPFAHGEEAKLLEKVKKNDNEAVSRLIEGYLLHVVEVAKQYSYSGVLVEDLIGEGNIGLMAGVGSLSDVHTVEQLKEHLEVSIRNAILAILDEVVDLSDLERRVIERANYLNSASNELAEDMGRDPSLEELSEYTKISIEDIKDILQISGDNIKVKIEHTHSTNKKK